MNVLEVDRYLLFNYLLLASEDEFLIFFFIAKGQGEKKMFFLISAELTISVH